mgnify:CR=1 FL=1
MATEAPEEKLAKKITDAMSLSAVAQQVAQLAGDINCSVAELDKVISKDPAMSSKLIKMANSSLFGFFKKSRNVSDAVTRLGLKQTRNLAYSFCVGNLVSGEKSAEGHEHENSQFNVWCHSVAAGALNDLLAKHSGARELRKHSDAAFLTGLLHDIGVILADQYKHKDYYSIPGMMTYLNQSLPKVESRFLGFTHEDLGARVLEKWKFPKEVVDAVQGHHSPGQHLDNPLTPLTGITEYVLASNEFPGFHDVPADIPAKGLEDIKFKLEIIGEPFNEAIEEFWKTAPELMDIYLQ